MSHQDPIEPIAIVGMAMRFPGGSHSSEEFWDMLCKGRSAHSPIPKSRYNADGYYHPDPLRSGAINAKGGYFLSEDPLAFDAPFFSMTATEANGTDPQQRLLLEVTYEALENAGIPIQVVQGSQTSVFVGCFTNDFESIGGRDPYGGPFYAATGNGASMLSNRVSWFYDLKGPSMTIDTACSSSLYAVHLACQSLRMGESKMSLVGGSNLIYDPSYMRDMTQMKFLSPDGICHSFDHRANGYARGDGVGGIVLKTLKQALADGDTIRAIIRNSGLGQDGKTPGITMPKSEAHAALIRSTYEMAGLSLDDTGYFEAHGTGTFIGDPIELSALGETFGKSRSSENPLYVGSVKTNIGHLEGCAGLAGLMKAALVVERGQIPPLADFEKANPRLKLEEWKIALPESLVSWPTNGLRRASVNSFGYGGANAHLIIDDAYYYLQERGLQGNHQTVVFSPDLDTDSGFGSALSTPGSEDGHSSEQISQKLFVLSSADPAGLSRVSSAYAGFLGNNLDFEKQRPSGQVDWSKLTADMAHTLSYHRTALDHRTFVVGRSGTDIKTLLEGPVPKMRRTAKNDKVFFIFTGQGAQWPAMGRELIGHHAFNLSLQESQDELIGLGCKWLLEDEMFAEEESKIDSPEYAQPLCTALQIALVDLLRTWGIKPSAVVGHSSGEIAAAYAAGAITHQNAIKIAYLRGIYSADVEHRQPVRGAMMAIGLSEEEVTEYLPHSVVVACVNSPKGVTLSGDEIAILELKKTLADKSVFARKLRVQTAYHSPQMTIIAGDYLQAMGDLSPKDTEVTMFSSVTARPISGKDLGASYWVKNMVGQVRFSDALHALLTQPAPGKRRKIPISYAAAIEIGPAPALKGPVLQTFTATDERLVSSILYTSMLERGKDSETTALTAAGKIWGQGIKIHLNAVNFQEETGHQRLATLPPYPWNHSTSYSHSSAWGKMYRFRDKPRTDLLGLRVPDASELKWQNWLKISEQPWLEDHQVQHNVLLPGSSMVVMAIEAARELTDPARALKGIEVRDVEFKKSVMLPTSDSVETSLHLRPIAPGSYEFKLLSMEEEWVENCSGTVLTHYKDELEADSDASLWRKESEKYANIRTRSVKTVLPKTFYRIFDKKMNLQYGPLHRNVTECVSGIGEGYGTITIPNTKSVMPAQFEYPHLIHPATLDSVFHMQALGYLHTLTGEESLVPISIDSIYVSADVDTAPGSQLKGFSKGRRSGNDSVGDIVLSDNWSAPRVVVRGFLSRDMSTSFSDTRKCTQLDWVEYAPPSKPVTTELDVPQPPSIDVSGIAIVTGKMSDAISLLVEKVSAAFPYHVRTVDIADYVFEDGVAVISLLEAEDPVVATWTENELDQFKSLTSSPALLWITRGGSYSEEEALQFSITTGLLRAVRVEIPRLQLPHLDLAPGELATDFNVDFILTAFNAVFDVVSEQEFMVAEGKLFVPRLVNDDSFHAQLSTKRLEPVLSKIKDRCIEGSLVSGSIVWQEMDEGVLDDLDVEIQVSSAHQNGADVVGHITRTGNAVTGFTVGDYVVALSSGLRTRVVVSEGLVKHVPDFADPISLVALPSSICIAHAALVEISGLQPGESILIHASGSLEAVLIQIAMRIGATVFAVARDEEHERNLVQLGVKVIMSTSNVPFTENLLQIVQQGIDVAVSTTGDALACVADFGRFVGLGDCSIVLSRCITASNFDFDHLKAKHPSRAGKLLDRAWERCRKMGLPPVPVRSSRADSTTTDVITFDPNHELLVLPKLIKLQLDPEATYVLSGGMGGIGRSIAEMMFQAGARNIKFLSRSGGTNPILDSLRDRGCNAESYSCDITDPAQVQEFVNRFENIKGVVQCAMVLRDNMFETMTHEQWTEATRPKVLGSWNLHHYMPELDFFIMLSSMAGVIGNPGQANYSAAGTYQDALSKYRRSKGLASLTIDLGIVSDVGYIAENGDQFERLEYLENLFISERELHSIVSAGMLGCTSDGNAVPPQLITGVGKELLYQGDLGIGMSLDLKYQNLEWTGTSIEKVDLESALTLRDACTIVEGVLSEEIARSVNMDAGDVDMEKPMHTFGVDSLVAVEVRNMIFRKMKAEISVFDILSPMPLVKLSMKIVGKSKFTREEVARQAIEELSD